MPADTGIETLRGLAPAAARAGRVRRWVDWRPGSIWPGLALTCGIAAAALLLRRLPGVAVFSPMILAIVIGIALRNAVGAPAWARPGVTFGLKRLLRFAIILLGCQLTAAQIGELGLRGFAIVAAGLAATFLFTTWLGRAIGADRKLCELIAAGTAVCGASAVVATNAVTAAPDEDAAYAVACVTLFGSLAMFLYPLLPAALGLDAQSYGLWAGASIHEIAQVVAASFQEGQSAGEFGTIAKLSRVILLAPLVLCLSAVMSRSGQGRGVAAGKAAPMPWFVLGFVALAAVNTVFPIPPEARAWIGLGTGFLMSIALAGMGLAVDLRKLRAKGPKPIVVAAAAWVFIAGFSLALIKFA